MHEIGRCNFARYFFLPNSARKGISACSRNGLKISDFYLNSLLLVGTDTYMYLEVGIPSPKLHVDVAISLFR